ncbi:MAG: DNA repair and recombination protein RadB, partial [Thermoplasmata archaeon]
MKIEVACPSLDALLDGGIESGCITLLFGEAGS